MYFTMMPKFRFCFLLFGWLTTFFVVPAHGKICRIDVTIDYVANPDNIYNCNENQDCCIEGGRPSCCSNKDADEEVIDQVKLWGGVIGAAIAVGILICCCRRDSGCCEGDEDCKYYVCCGCCRSSRGRKSSKDDDDVDYERFSPPESPHSAISTVSHEDQEEEEKKERKGFSVLGIGSLSGPLVEKDRSEASSQIQQLQEIRAKDLADQLNAP